MTPRPRLVFLVQQADRGVRKQLAAASKSSSLSAAAAGVLFYLERHPDALVADVTAALGASASGMSGLLSRMEAAGLVTKSVDPEDRRAVHLSLTAAGREACPPAARVAAEINDRLCAGFTDEEIAVVSRWLQHAARVDRA